MPLASMLYVDDESDLLEIVQEYWAGEGFDVYTASSGQAALAILKRVGSIDLLVTDMRMTNGDGLFLLQTIRDDKLPVAKVFVVSGYSSSSFADLNTLGVHEYLAKPVDLNFLDAQIRGISHGKSLESSSPG